jgi:hypothetical protein
MAGLECAKCVPNARPTDCSRCCSWQRLFAGDADFTHRPWLAIVRALEPLLAVDETGGIERGWGELTPGEQRAYLKAALEREAILLNRPPDLERA